MIEHKILQATNDNYEYEFAIATLVTSREEYAVMKNSFIECGFSDNCEYLIADNVEKNSLDAYQAIAGFLKTNRAKYLIVVHQDVRCIDSRDDLLQCLQQLSLLDNNWAICGNAGAYGYHNDMIHIQNNGKIVKSNNLPARANSLDENFLVIKTSTAITISPDLTGFHLYGTDLAIIADFLGYSCYVIPFMVNHLSLGNLVELKKQVPSFVSIYGHKLRNRYIQTPCTSFYLSNGTWKNRLYNTRFIFFFVKALQRFNQAKQFISHGRRYKKSIERLPPDPEA
jgi:hypothetical protein